MAHGNYSRIGRTQVVFAGGRPTGVKRLGIALEPEESWESKGVEDPRISFLAALGLWVMAYTAYGAAGPRGRRRDLGRPRALGPARTRHLRRRSRRVRQQGRGVLPGGDTDPGRRNNSRPPAPSRERGPARHLGLVHRGSRRAHPADHAPPRGRARAALGGAEDRGGHPTPLRAATGWLLLYHGVSGRIEPGLDLQPDVRYCAGAMVLDAEAVWKVVWRSTEPLLEPETRDEREGIVGNVVFPTAIDGTDVYYGMADARIGAARLSF